jgi:hypothetical protein
MSCQPVHLPHTLQLHTVPPSGNQRSDILEPISHRIPHRRNPPTKIQPLHPLPPQHLPRNPPTRRQRRRRRCRVCNLCADLDQLRRRRDDKRRQSAQHARDVDLRVGRRRRGAAGGEEFEGAVVGDEEEGVERAVAEDGSRCSYLQLLDLILVEQYQAPTSHQRARIHKRPSPRRCRRRGTRNPFGSSSSRNRRRRRRGRASLQPRLDEIEWVSDDDADGTAEVSGPEIGRHWRRVL